MSNNTNHPTPSKDYQETKKYLGELKKRIEEEKTEKHINFFCFMFERLDTSTRKADTIGVCDNEEFIEALARSIVVNKDTENLFKMVLKRAIEIMENDDND